MSAAAPADFDRELQAIADRARAARSGQPLAASIDEHRRLFERPEAVDAFQAIQRAGSRSEVH
jgi:hypothetical protein